MLLYTEVDFREMFLECGFTHLPTGNSGLCKCPLHADNHPSMSITINRGLFNCFSCGYKGRIDKEYFLKFGHKYNPDNNVSIKDLRNYINSKQIVDTIKEYKKGFTINAERILSSTFENWLNYRGISKQVALDAKAFYGNVEIKYTDDYGKEKIYYVNNRVMFPIYNSDKKLVNLEMRYPFNGKESKAFKEKTPKVLYPKRSTTNLLYEEYNLNKSEKLYLTEGLMDCLSFRSLTNIKNSTTIFGANITNHQKDLLNKFPEICYVYNNDKAGLESVDSLKKSYRGKLTLLKPYGEFDDVGEMTMNKFKEVENWLKKEQ